MFVKEGRKPPTQERSKRRLAQILEAAANELAEKGFEGTTMEGIAARASTSIGSVYRFFRDKQEVLNALATGYRENLRSFFALLMASGLDDRPWQDLLSASIDALAAFHEAQPGFRAVWVSMRMTHEFIAEGEAMNDEIAAQVATLLASKLAIPKKKLGAVSRMTVEVMTVSLITAARRPAEAKEVMEETKALLERYLAPYDQPRVRSKSR